MYVFVANCLLDTRLMNEFEKLFENLAPIF